MKIKNLIKYGFCSMLLVLIVGNFTCAENFVFTDLGISADVYEDWTIKVSETYVADFFVKMHGIFRTIPLNYSVDWNKFHIDVSNISVSWKKFSTSKANWKWTVKIWDPDSYVHWKVDYPISYTVYWLIRNFSWMWYSELYWNIVWYEFETSIQNVTAVINLPKIYTWFTSSNFLITADWISTSLSQFQWKVDWSEWDKIVITYDKWLAAWQWITLSIKFPNGYFLFDDDKQAKLIWDANEWILWSIRSFFAGIDENDFAAIFVLIFFVPYFIFLNRQKKIQNGWKIFKLKWDFAKKYKVIVQYSPPKWLNSAEVGLLLHRDANIKDLFSLIYKWASEWLIEINANLSEKAFWLIKTWSIKITKIKDISVTAPGYEQRFFNRFMDRKEKDLSKYDKEHLVDLNRLKTYWIQMWWFKNKDRSFSMGKPLVFAIILLFILSYFSYIFYLIIIMFIIFVRLLVFFNWKLTITDKWAELLAHILWYKQFLAACDEKQLRTFLSQDPLYFDKALPYAIVFWMETEFLKKIMPIMAEYNITPTWYKWFVHFDRILSSVNTVWAKSVYTKSGWFGWWSSFWWWFSGWWWGWWGWWWGW